MLATPAVSEQPLEVSGRIVTPAGPGLAGATVEVAPLPPVGLQAERQLDGDGRPRPVASSRTDAAGRFRVTVPHAGFWRLAVSHADVLPAQRDLSPLLASLNVGTLTIEASSRLSVRLVDGEGQPVAGARVAARSWSERWRTLSEDGWWPRDLQLETSSDGVVRVPCGIGERVSLAAFRDGRFAHQVVSCTDGELLLELAGELAEAVVVDAGGAAVASAVGFVRWPFLAFGRSDDDGRLRGPWRPEEPVPVAFADGAGFYPEPQLGWTVVDGEKLAVFQLAPTVAVTGRVVDAVDGEPVPGAWLWLGRSSHYFLTADGDGEFLWRVPADRPVPLHAAGRGYFENVAEEAAGNEGRRILQIRLAPELRRAGRVVDDLGRGIADAEVQARVSREPRAQALFRRAQGESRWTIPEAAVRSDASGSFELDRLAPHTPFELTVRRSGFATRIVELAAFVPGEAVDDLEIVLQRARNGFGRVVDDAGTPLAGAEVELFPALVGSGAELDFGAGGVRRTYTDAEGRFLLSDLGPGTYYLAARAHGYPEVLVPGVEIEPGTMPVDLGTVGLSPGVRVHGRVRDDSGEAVAGVKLQVRLSDGEQIVVQRGDSPWFATATSGADGSYQFVGLPIDRRLDLLILGEGLLPERRAVTTTDADLELDVSLERGARLAGRVVAADGAPATGAVVEVARVEPEQPADVTTRRRVAADERGVFEMGGLRPGTYELNARRDGGVADPLRREVTGTGVDGVELLLRIRGVLEGRVIGPEGAPVAGASVRVEPLAGGVGSFEAADEAGRFRVAGLAAGSYRVVAGSRGFEAASVEAAVADGRRTSVELRLEEVEEPETFEVSGRVVDLSGQPLDDVRVVLHGVPAASGAYFSPTTRSRVDGTFRLDAPAGEYRLVCRRAEFARYEGGLFVLDGDRRDLVLTLERGVTIVGTLAGLDLDDFARVAITARGRDGHHYGTINYQGEFRIPNLHPGTWTVRAELLNPTRAAWETVEVAPGDDEVRVDLRFEPGYRVSGRAYLEGLPMAGGTVALECLGEFRGETFTGDDGRFAIADVPEGRCSAVLSDRRSGRSVQRELEVAGDVEVVLEIRLAER